MRAQPTVTGHGPSFSRATVKRWLPLPLQAVASADARAPAAATSSNVRTPPGAKPCAIVRSTSATAYSLP